MCGQEARSDAFRRSSCKQCRRLFRLVPCRLVARRGDADCNRVEVVSRYGVSVQVIIRVIVRERCGSVSRKASAG